MEQDAEEQAIYQPHQAFYIHAMLFCTRSAWTSINTVSRVTIEYAFKSRTGVMTPAQQDDYLNSLQNIIVQGAALSRYFWPSKLRIKSSHLDRASFLKRVLGVSEDSVLKDRALRDQIEHFDEKLDHYLVDGITGYVIPQFVGTSSATGVPLHVFRAYYSDTNEFEMLGKRCEIEPIMQEITRIHDLLIKAEGNGGIF